MKKAQAIGVWSAFRIDMDAAEPSKPIFDCFVFSGGGSKGAYGAGVAKAIGEYRALKGLQNPICYVGASAGALNAYILASKGPDALIAFWLEVTNRSILGARDPRSKLRVASKYVREYFSSAPRSVYSNKALAKLVTKHASLASLHSPLVIAATDYTRGRLRAFYSSDLIDRFMITDAKAELKDRRLRQFRRIDDDAMLIKVLLASAAIPIFFPPVGITSRYGATTETDLFIDGGVGNNTPTREAAYFLRFLDAEGDGEAGVTFCVKQEQPRTIQDEAARLEFGAILLRTLDVYHDVHTRPIIGAWNRINNEVANQTAALERFDQWLAAQALEPALRNEIAARIRSELGSPGGQAPRLDMPLMVIEPTVPLGETLDFSPSRARDEIRHGYGDALKALRQPIGPDHPSLDEAEFDELSNRPLFPEEPSHGWLPNLNPFRRRAAKPGHG